LYLLTGGLFALQLVALAAALAEAHTIAHVAVKIDRESLDHLAGRLMHLPLGYFDTRRSGTSSTAWRGCAASASSPPQQGVQASRSVASCSPRSC